MIHRFSEIERRIPLATPNLGVLKNRGIDEEQQPSCLDAAYLDNLQRAQRGLVVEGHGSMGA